MSGQVRIKSGLERGFLGGMSSGFGLRVVLPTKPWEDYGGGLGWMGCCCAHPEVVGRMSGIAKSTFPANIHSKGSSASEAMAGPCNTG